MNLRLSAANLKGAASQTFRKIFTLAVAISLALALPGAQAIYSDSQPLCKSGVAVAAPQTTNEEILAICTIPADAMRANSRLRFWALITFTNNANNKTIRVRHSGIAGATYVFFVGTTQTGIETFTEISNRGTTNSQIGAMGRIVTAVNTLNATNTTIVNSQDTTVPTTLVITCTKAVGTDSCQLESYLVELIGGGT
jgi:hypothetical protein